MQLIADYTEGSHIFHSLLQEGNTVQTVNNSKSRLCPLAGVHGGHTLGRRHEEPSE